MVATDSSGNNYLGLLETIAKLFMYLYLINEQTNGPYSIISQPQNLFTRRIMFQFRTYLDFTQLKKNWVRGKSVSNSSLHVTCLNFQTQLGKTELMVLEENVSVCLHESLLTGSENVMAVHI